MSNSGRRESPPMARSPLTAGFFATFSRKSPEPTLAGWGGRNRTAKWRLKKKPLILCQNFGDLTQIEAQRFLRGSVAETEKGRLVAVLRWKSEKTPTEPRHVAARGRFLADCQWPPPTQS